MEPYYIIQFVMKKIYTVGVLILLLLNASFLRAQSTISAVEKRLTDSLCNCVSKLDVSKITTAEDAEKQYTNCVEKNIDQLQSFANERHVDFSDKAGMRNLGIDLAKDLMKMNCSIFMDLATLMAKKQDSGEETNTGSTTGSFKRIDLKGFNYLIIVDQNNSEKSFLWLRQFTGSEKFSTGSAKLIGKQVKISWQELEVYLPQANGYYKVKEITAVEFL